MILQIADCQDGFPAAAAVSKSASRDRKAHGKIFVKKQEIEQ